MNPHLYLNRSLDGAPAAELNNLTLDDGRLLVSVYLAGDIGGPRIAFDDPAQVEPWLLAFDGALKLLRQGQAELDKRLAGKQAKEAAEAEYRAGKGLADPDPGDDPTSLDEDAQAEAAHAAETEPEAYAAETARLTAQPTPAVQS